MSRDRPKETELEDLQRRARSLQGTPEQIIKRRHRAVLLHQIAKYSERSPKSIKKFLDLNADNIVELHQAYEQAGRKDLADSLQKIITENLINPVYASINRQADRLLKEFEQRITDNKIDDNFLREMQKSMVKIISNLGFEKTADPIQTQRIDNLMEKFSVLMVKAHEPQEFSQLRIEINQLADEIDKILDSSKEEDLAKIPLTKSNPTAEAKVDSSLLVQPLSEDEYKKTHFQDKQDLARMHGEREVNFQVNQRRMQEALQSEQNNREKKSEDKVQNEAPEKRWWRNQVDQRGMMAKEPKGEKQARPSSTAQLLNNIAPKADILASVSVANPLAGVKAASIVRADPAGLINAKPKQEQAAEKQKKPGFIDVIKNKLKI